MKKSRKKTPVRAAIYARISKDKSGEEKGVDRQEADCRALAERLGWEVVGVYIDNDISASKGKPRPQYQAMLQAIRQGQINGLLAWHPDRLNRRAADLEKFLPIVEAHNVQVQTVTAGEYDLSTASGRMNARILGSVAQGEVERSAERIRRAMAQMREEGRYKGGMRPFGYEKDGTTVREDEAQVVRELCTSLLAGRGVKALAGDLNERGIPTTQGNTWKPTNLRQMLLRPRNAGLIATGRPHIDEEIVGQAQWPPLVDEETWRAVRALLMDPSRRTHSGIDSAWLGSGIYRCGKCGGKMRSSAIGQTPSKPTPDRRYTYRCRDHAHLTIMAVPTDNYVRPVVVDLIRDPRVVAAMNPAPTDSLSADRERRAVLAARLDGFEADYAAGAITGQQLQKATQRVEAELVEVDERLAKGMSQSTASPIALAPDPGLAFLDAPLDVQRAVLSSLLTVEVLPSLGRGRAWTAERLRITPVAALDDLDLSISA